MLKKLVLYCLLIIVLSCVWESDRVRKLGDLYLGACLKSAFRLSGAVLWLLPRLHLTNCTKEKKGG